MLSLTAHLPGVIQGPGLRTGAYEDGVDVEGA